MLGQSKLWMKRFGTATVAMLCLGVWTGTALADKPPPSPSACKTTGHLTVSTPSPSSYSYVQNALGETSGSFTVFSPTGKQPSNCDTSIGYTFGNTESDTIEVTVKITEVTDVGTGAAVAPEIKDAVVAAFSLTPDSFELTPPGTGSHSVSFTFTNSLDIPVGDYDVNIQVKSAGNGVGTANITFNLEATEPTAFDTLAPVLAIQSPTKGASIVVNGTLTVSFTANDPEEDGAGTGVTSVAASIASLGGAVDEDITPDLSVDPSLPVPAGITVRTTADIQMTAIGSYSLTAEATDGASHTGYSSESFTVKANMACLPPVSMSGRVFKSGSTVPVKWAFTDANEAFLPPYASIKVAISGPSTATAVAGSGASNIRWELDSAGNATQYIVNFPIPATATGTYTATISVQDVDGNEAVQGTCTFIVSPKGGKA